MVVVVLLICQRLSFSAVAVVWLCAVMFPAQCTHPDHHALKFFSACCNNNQPSTYMTCVQLFLPSPTGVDEQYVIVSFSRLVPSLALFASIGLDWIGLDWIVA